MNQKSRSIDQKQIISNLKIIREDKKSERTKNPETQQNELAIFPI